MLVVVTVAQSSLSRVNLELKSFTNFLSNIPIFHILYSAPAAAMQISEQLYSAFTVKLVG